MDAIIADEWDQDIGFEGAAAVNMQGGFAGALLHLGHMAVVDANYSGLQSYFDRGARLAALFRSQVDIEDDCSCSSYSNPVLRTGSHNSYWWYHSGWHYGIVPSCANSCLPFFHFDQPDLNSYQKYIEDISHAIPALIIPFMSHKYSVYTSGFYPFTDTELVRFRNTFTKHVWDANAGGFHSAVNGQDSPIYPPADNGQFDLLQANALAWMPLQRFDQAAGAAAGDQLYDVIMGFYSNEVHGQPTSLTAGFHYLGLADVVAAQWERECFSLTMFNRDLVYDQDFAARSVLTVDAYGEAGASFSDPVITEPRFTIKSGISSKFRAGDAVVWQPGFEAELGSTVEVVIDPLGCGMEYKSLTSDGSNAFHLAEPQRAVTPLSGNDEGPDESRALHTEEVFEVRLVPNPSTGRFDLVTSVQTILTSVFDPQGREVLRTRERSIDLTGHAPGLYTAVVTTEQGRQAVRLVLQRE